MTLDIHTLFYAALAVVVGFHSMLFWVFAKVYGMREGFVPPDPHFLKLVGHASLERCLLAGGVLILAGLILGFVALHSWSNVEFGGLNVTQTMRLVIPSGAAIMVGLHLVYGAFFLNLLHIRASVIDTN